MDVLGKHRTNPKGILPFRRLFSTRELAQFGSAESTKIRTDNETNSDGSPVIFPCSGYSRSGS
jgi:hypothetical protein